MVRTTLLILMLAVLATAARAQDCCQKMELFGGYSYLNAGVQAAQTASVEQFNLRKGQQGFGANLTFNLNNRFGLAGDMSYDWGAVRRGDAEVDTSSLYFLFGPRISSRDEGVNIFGHALAGGCRTAIRSSGSTGLAFGFGGGVDLNVRGHFAVRVIQADYLPTHHSNFGFDSIGRWNHNFRFQTGVVFSFGGVAK